MASSAPGNGVSGVQHPVAHRVGVLRRRLPAQVVSQRQRPPQPRQCQRLQDLRQRDVVQRAPLVVVTPAAGVRAALEQGQGLQLAQHGTALLRSTSNAADPAQCGCRVDDRLGQRVEPFEPAQQGRSTIRPRAGRAPRRGRSAAPSRTPGAGCRPGRGRGPRAGEPPGVAVRRAEHQEQQLALFHRLAVQLEGRPRPAPAALDRLSKRRSSSTARSISIRPSAGRPRRRGAGGR